MSMATVMSQMPDLWRRVLTEHAPDHLRRCRGCCTPTGMQASWPCQTFKVADEARALAEGYLPVASSPSSYAPSYDPSYAYEPAPHYAPEPQYSYESPYAPEPQYAAESYAPEHPYTPQAAWEPPYAPEPHYAGPAPYAPEPYPGPYGAPPQGHPLQGYPTAPQPRDASGPQPAYAQGRPQEPRWDDRYEDPRADDRGWSYDASYGPGPDPRYR